MIIKYDTNELKEICNDKRLATREIGTFNTKKLKRVMTYLNGAVNYKQIKQDSLYGFHALKGDRSGQYGMDLNGGTRLSLEFLDDTGMIKMDDNALTVVRITEIKDYHK